jgi:hypothetical protein
MKGKNMNLLYKTTLFFSNTIIILLLFFASYGTNLPLVKPVSALEIDSAIVAFNKIAPANGATISLPASTYYLLQWTDAKTPSTDRYQYCIDQTNNNSCDNNKWITRNSLYSGAPNEFTLTAGKTYYWQVRTRDAGTVANGGTWWSFKISGSPPALNKTTPTNAATISFPSSTYYLLEWTDLGIASTDRYQYCIDQTNNNSCDNNKWITRNSLYSGAGEFSLTAGKTYYWQVRARDAGTVANGGTWWSFKISGSPPALNKTTPANGSSIPMPASVYYLLQWTDLSIPITDRYQYCIDQTNNNSCDNNKWITRNSLYSGTGEFILSYGKTYYWQVRARDAGTVANGGTWWSFSIQPLAAAPAVSSILRTTPSTSSTNATSVVFTVTFSQAVTGVDISDFSLTTTGVAGASISSVNGVNNTNTRTVTVNTGTGNGTLRLNLIDNDSIKNSQNSPLGGVGSGNGSFAGQVYTIDKSNPSIVSIVRTTPATATTDATSVVFTVTFSQAVTGVDSTDFSLTTTGVAGAFIDSVSGVDNTTTRTVTVNTGTGNGTIRLDVADDDTILNSFTTPLGGSGVGNGSFTSGEVYTIDKTLPAPNVISIVRTTPPDATTDAVSVIYTITFDQAVTGVDISDFLLTIGVIPDASIVSVDGVDNTTTRTITINTGTGDGTIRLNFVDDDTVQNIQFTPIGGVGAGNGSFTSGEVYTIDKP